MEKWCSEDFMHENDIVMYEHNVFMIGNNIFKHGIFVSICFFFMHENENVIFMHGIFIFLRKMFMPRYFHARNISHVTCQQDSPRPTYLLRNFKNMTIKNISFEVKHCKL